MAMTDDELRRFNEAMLDAIQTMNGLTAETMRLTAAEKAAAEKAAEQKAKADAAFGAISAVGKAFVSYNKAIYDGESANKAAASSMDGLSEAAKLAGVGLALLIPGGPLIKAVVAGLGLLASKVIEVGKVLATQTDTVYKSYQQLAEAGATGAGAATELTHSLFKVGLGISKYNEFIRIIKDNSQTLANFGGTVTQGRKVLETTMESLTDKQRIQLEMMGLDRVGQAEATLNYIKQQRMLTIGTKLQMDTSSTAVMRYIKETDELTRITGLNRKEQEKMHEDAMREEAYFATLIQIAEEKGPEAAKRVQEALIMAAKSGGPEIAKQFKDSVSGFVGSSDEAGKALMATNGRMQDLGEKLRSGQLKDTVAVAREMEGVAKAYGETAKQFRGQAQMMNFGPTFGSFYEAVTFGKMGVEGFANAVKKAQKQADDAQKTDAATRDLAEAENNVRKTEINQQKVILLGMAAYARTQVGVTEALLRLSEAALAAAESLHKIPTKSEGPPVGPVPSTAEAKQDREKAEKSVLDLQKQREDSQKKVDDQRSTIEKLEQALADAKKKNNQQEVARLEAEIEALRAARMKEMQQHQENRLKEYEARRQAEIARAREESARKKKSQEGGVTGQREPLPSAPKAPGGAPGGAPAAPGGAPAAPGGAPAAPGGAPGGAPAAPGGGMSEATTGTPPTALALLEEKGRKHLEEIFVFGKRGPDSTKERFLRLEDKLESAAIAAAQQFWEQTKKPIQVNSAVRTKEEQQKLWDQTDPNTYDPKTGLAIHKQTGLPVLHPNLGGSHQNGTGLDIQNTSLNSLDPIAQASFATFLRQPLGARDAVHWSLADGGVATGPKSGYPATLHGTEAVVPLPDGQQIPVKLNGGIGPTFAGYNEYTGYNMGPMSTDLNLIKDLATSMGAFDRATQTITNPATWKEIVGSGIGMNYQIGDMKFGSSVLPNLGQEMAQRISEIVSDKGVDQTEAFKTMVSEFRTAMTDAVAKLTENQNNADVAGLLADLVTRQTEANDISNKILSYAQN